MIRFTKQKDHYSCGPVAIINLCKWAGFEFDAQKWLKKFKKLTNCDTEGTYPDDLYKALKKLDTKYFKLKKQYKYKVKFKDLRNHCNDTSGVVLLRFTWPKKDSRHYIIVTKFTKQKVEVINYFSTGRAVRFITKSTFKKLLKTKPLEGMAWLITKSSKQKGGSRLSSSDF